MEKKNKNYIKMTAIVAIVANLSITIIELLVLFRILPYELIGGGRMGSYEKAAVLAVFSILIQVVLVYCTAVAANILPHKKMQKIAGVILRVFIVYFTINIAMNLMGKTWFERVYGSLICLVQIVCFSIIVHRRKNGKQCKVCNNG